MDQLHLLFLLSFSMLIGSFLSGTIPMAFKLSDSKSRLLALMGSGILIGTALAIIIPEGIDAIYIQPASVVVPAASNVDKLDQHKNNFNTNNQSIQEQEPVQSWTIGISLITGFVLMLFIDQFSIYQSNNNDNNNSTNNTSSQNNQQQLDYSLANQDEIDIDDDDDDDEILFSKRDTNHSETTSEIKPITNDIDTHRILMTTITNPTSNGPNRATGLKQIGRARKQKVTPTLGLVIHAAADGIALGAAATTSHRDTEMIIFLAIMLHKAPAAFSLVVFLLHRGLKHSTIRRHLLAFSFSAPLAALLTFFGLSQSGKEALRRNNATGIVMLFSAGTFLYVATMHVLPELVNNILLTPKEMLFLVGGAFLPVLLAQTI